MEKYKRCKLILKTKVYCGGNKKKTGRQKRLETGIINKIIIVLSRDFESMWIM